MNIQTTRRGFLKGVASTSAVLVIGLNAKGTMASGTADAQINPFVKINADGTVTAIIKHFEMGQGVSTGLTTLIAEELDADWSKVNFEFAPANSAVYANLLFGLQGTGGSTAIANSFMQYREAGAVARDLLVRAAADQWGVSPESVKVEDSILSSGNHTAHFGEVANAALELTPTDQPKLKEHAEFKIIGKRVPRQDSSAKTDGSAKFAMDIKVPGVVYVGIIRSPKFGGVLTSFDASAAKNVSGFVDAKAMPDNTGVAVYAKNTWAVKKSRDAISVDWDFSGAETRSTAELQSKAFGSLENPTYKTTETTDFDATASAIQGSDHTIEFDFLAPFLAHAPLEPLNCVIEPTGDGVVVYDGCQMPGAVQPAVGAVLGLSPDKVQVKTVFAGGSFGRRANPTSDYHTEAAVTFKLLGGQTPIKLVWTREDDIKGGYYRPIAAHRVKIGVNNDGKITGWDHRIAAKSIMKGTAFEPIAVINGVDNSSVEGVNDTHYNIPAFSVGLSDIESPMKALWWRAVGHTHTAFAMETAIDMIAEKISRDPVELRLELLSGDDDDQKRLAGVLKLVAEKSNWGSPVSAGKGRGVALHKSFGTYVAEVADVSIVDGDIKIDNITCAVDCGIAVNPDVIVAQMEGAIGYGLGAAMRNQITLTDGVVDQENFPDYELLRMSDMPNIDVHIVPSMVQPSGVGEPGLPPVAPALGNAIAAATGNRVTSLPFTEHGVSFV